VTASTLSRASLAAPGTLMAGVQGKTRRVVTAGLLLALACVLGLVESAIAAPVAGTRLGLANIAIVVALGVLGERSALAICVLRVGIVGLATGSLFGPASALAFAGALAAWSAMCIALRSRAGFSYVGVSVCGAVAHIFAQYAVVVVLTGAVGILFLAPVSLITSLLFGIVTGYAARYVISRVEVSHPSGR
jgi:heptaprenyl diphosphate synthase